jgi:hypothetical protein
VKIGSGKCRTFITFKLFDSLKVKDALVQSVYCHYFSTVRVLCNYFSTIRVLCHYLQAPYLQGHTALCEIPNLAGFYSKDFILEMLSMRYVNIFCCCCCLCLKCGAGGGWKRSVGPIM